MNLQPGHNMLDLLLGLNATKSGARAGRPGGKQKDDRRFGDLLGLLSVGAAPQNGFQIAKSTFLDGLAGKPRPIINKVIEVVTEKMDAGLLTGPESAGRNLRRRTEIPGETKAGQIKAWFDPPAAGKSARLRPASVPVAQTADGEPVTLKPGTYPVEGVSLRGEEVQLKLTAASQGQRDVRVTLRVQDLADVTAPTGPTVRNLRVRNNKPATGAHLTQAAGEPQKLERLLAGLNIREIEIRSDRSAAVLGVQRADQRRMSAEIVPVPDGREMMLRSGLQKSASGINRPTRSSAGAARSESLSAESTFRLTTDRPSSLMPTAPAERVRAADLLRSGAEPTAWKELLSGDVLSGDLFDADGTDLRPPGLSQASSSSTSTPTGKPDSAPIRFIIPENAAGQLRPGGGSVAIRIEPEHLGPMRLRLSVQGQTLTGHLIVESVQARQLLEASLDQLLDQLARAGIEVDKLDVGLSGEDTRDLWFAHQSNRRRPEIDVNHLEEAAGTETERSPTETAVPGTIAYIGADRVNILA
jgi:hypothetical protein